MVLELRPPGMDKGVALLEYVREVHAEAVMYAGDDLGDLPPSPPSTNCARTASRACWCAAAARKSPNWPNGQILWSTARRESYAC